MRGWVFGLAVTCAASCTTAETEPPSWERSPLAADGGSYRANADGDHDGVCDATETEDFASDPRSADSDRDGLPDFTEIVGNYNITDPTSPNPDQIAYLTGAPQAVLDFTLRMTVEGSGLGYTGDFQAANVFDSEGLTAKDFLEGAVALGGEPPDNIRGVQSESERFTSVLGKTRLSFSLRFRVGPSKLPDCTSAYPFEYRLKADDGKFVAVREYLLVVTREGKNGEPPSFCVPATCF